MAYKYYTNPQSQIIFSADGPQPQPLYTNGKAKIIVVGLKAGQKIPVHPEGLSVFHFIDGKGVMIVDGERLPVQSGTVIITDEGASRGMEAETELKFMAVRITELPH